MSAKKWIKILSEKSFAQQELADNAYQFTPRLDNAVDMILRHTENTRRWPELEDILYKHTPVIYLYNNAQIYESVIIVPSLKLIYVKEFFYYTLVGKVLYDFQIYLLYLHLTLNQLYADLDIDTYNLSGDFLKLRRKSLNPDEFESVCYESDEGRSAHLRALIFLSYLYYQDLKKISLLEKKIIRDSIGISHAKKILGLDDSAYTYIEDKGSLNKGSEGQRTVYNEINAELDRKKIEFEEYTDSIIKHKRLALWIWWTISPFVSADIAILLPMIYETKSIRKVYIDLCRQSQDIIQDYISGKIDSEEIIENEVKKIYPPLLKNFQKETLPYMVLLNKLRELSIPVECYGFSGIELMETEPILSRENEIYYPIDKQWKRLLYSEYKYFTENDKNDLTIIFHFMKPMFIIPQTMQDERMEKIIHTDRFTGFGPQKPENRLSIYSYYASYSQKSFVIPEIAKSSMKDELIVFFPYQDNTSAPTLDDSKFNKFALYDTMIYSAHAGGGGGRRGHGILTPSNTYYQPVI